MKIKIALLSTFALLTSVVISMANPYVITGNFPSAVVDTCTFTLNTGTAVDIAPTSVNTTNSYCKYDVAASINGANVVSVVYKNVWGVSTSVPFSYAKTLPPTPSGLQLAQ
ncbi:hypothetical protein JZU46_00255 [bacterium]|nr:hypothetical protein [bacterium]